VHLDDADVAKRDPRAVEGERDGQGGLGFAMVLER
jgi:hypothetical protein